jgi:WD40 repeat protein
MREQEREAVVRQVQGLLDAPHTDGWSDAVRDRVGAAAAVRRDGALRDLAVSGLAGLDARPGPALPGYQTAGVVFDRAGRRLLLGGTNDAQARPFAPATLWDPDTGARQTSAQNGAGPVAFRADDTPVQLLARPGPSVLLWDVANQRPVCEGRFDPGAGRHLAFVIDDVDRQVLALSADGGLLAAAVTAGDSGQVGVWDGSSGRLLRQLPVRATALAFAPADADGEARLAVGDAEGRITLWPVRGGAPAGAPLHRGRSTVHALAFRGAGLLAAGDGSGTVTLWERRAEGWLPVTTCQGSPYAVYALAFGPDNMTLASGGREAVYLWDLATGRLLLRTRAGDYVSGLAFAPSAADPRLAVTNSDLNERKREARVWSLEPDRGVAALRGLSGQVAAVRFSPDGRLLAAVAHDWRVGVWELDTGRLRHVLEAPPGQYVDNATLAFDGDGRRLAYAAGERARLWDADTGAELASWRLPPALCDCLAFDAAGRLLSFRVETEDGKLPPYSVAPFREHPRVCRLRELPVPGEPRPLAAFGDFNRKVEAAAAVPGGGCFVADGIRDDGAGPPRRALKAFDTARAEVRWEVPLAAPTGSSDMGVDPEGRVVKALAALGPRETVVVDVATGQELGRVRGEEVTTLAPGGGRWVGSGPPDAGSRLPRGFRLFRAGRPGPLVTLGGLTQPSGTPAFDRSGGRVAWGNRDGSVTVCDLARVRERLRALGLDWEE